MDGLAQDGVIEGKIRIVDEIGVGVALDHREPLRHAGIHSGLAQLDAPRIDAALGGEQAQQGPIAATNIEHARAQTSPSPQ